MQFELIYFPNTRGAGTMCFSQYDQYRWSVNQWVCSVGVQCGRGCAVWVCSVGVGVQCGCGCAVWVWVCSVAWVCLHLSILVHTYIPLCICKEMSLSKALLCTCAQYSLNTCVWYTMNVVTFHLFSLPLPPHPTLSTLPHPPGSRRSTS